MLYVTLLAIHNLMRWITLGLAVFALFRTARGRFGKLPWTPLDANAVSWFAWALTAQFFLGALFYLIPGTLADGFFTQPAEFMKVRETRFFLVEHSLLMMIALGLAHAGAARAKKATDPQLAHRKALGFGLAALLLVLASIPWPGPEYGRPLLPVLPE